MALEQNEDRVNLTLYGDLAHNLRIAAEKRFLSPQNLAKMVLGEYLAKQGRKRQSPKQEIE